MSKIQDRLEFMEHVSSRTRSFINTLGSLAPPQAHVSQPATNEVVVSTQTFRAFPMALEDLSSLLEDVGLDSHSAGRLNHTFHRITSPLYESITEGVARTCSHIMKSASFEGRDCGKIVDGVIAASRRIYEAQIMEIKEKFLQEARDLQAASHQVPPTSQPPVIVTPDVTDDDSNAGDQTIEDPDSDTEEAVNIERYYPVLEKMFLGGVVKPSRDEKLKLSERTGIPYYNIGIWFQNRRDRGPHAGKGEWMRKYLESRSITPAYISNLDGAETEDSVSDHGMSEFDEDEWETDPEDVPDLNLLELGPPARPPHASPAVHSTESSPRPSHPMSSASEFDSTPSTPFASSSRSISFESSSDSFSYSDVSFVSAGLPVYTGSPSPLLEPGAFLPSLTSHARTPAESQIHESSQTFSHLPTPTPSMSFSSSISPSFSAPLAQFGATPQMRSNTPSTAPSTPDEGPNTPPVLSFGFGLGTVPFGNSSRPNIPHPNLGLSPAVNDASPSQRAPQTPPMTFRSFNFEFSLTPSPTQGKFNDVDLSFGSFNIAPYSSAASFFDSFNANSNTPSPSDSASDYGSPDPQQLDPPSRTASPPPLRSILLDFAGVNENNWRPEPIPEPLELSSREDVVESRLLAAAALVVSRSPGQPPHNPSPFKLVPHDPISPRPTSPLMEPLFGLSSPLRDPSPIPSPTSPVMGMLPFLNHALRPPTLVDELAAYANLRVKKSVFPAPLTAEREGLDEPSPLTLSRHLELEPEPTQLSLFDVLKEPPVPVVDKATRDRVDSFFERYCTGRNGSSDETQAKPPCFPPAPHLPPASTSTNVPQDIGSN